MENKTEGLDTWNPEDKWGENPEAAHVAYQKWFAEEQKKESTKERNEGIQSSDERIDDIK